MASMQHKNGFTPIWESISDLVGDPEFEALLLAHAANSPDGTVKPWIIDEVVKTGPDDQVAYYKMADWLNEFFERRFPERASCESVGVSMRSAARPTAQ